MAKREKLDRTRDQYAVVLENIRDKVTIIAEATQPIPRMRKKFDATSEEVGNLRTDMETVKTDLRIIKNDLKPK